VVALAHPAIVTEASPAVDLGHAIYDRATLSGGADPTGKIEFKAYGPDDSSCTGTPAHASTVDVTRGNDTYTSASFTPTADGTYRWVARYLVVLC